MKYIPFIILFLNLLQNFNNQNYRLDNKQFNHDENHLNNRAFKFFQTTLQKEDFNKFYRDPACKFFVFQFTYVDADRITEDSLKLLCYPADQLLNLLNDGKPIKEDTTVPMKGHPISGGKLFNISNITVEKSMLDIFYLSGADPVLTAIPKKSTGPGIVYIKLDITNANQALTKKDLLAITLTVNPSPPATRRSAN